MKCQYLLYPSNWGRWYRGMTGQVDKGEGYG